MKGRSLSVGMLCDVLIPGGPLSACNDELQGTALREEALDNRVLRIDAPDLEKFKGWKAPVAEAVVLGL